MNLKKLSIVALGTMTLLFSCAGGPKTINVDTYVDDGDGFLMSNPFNVNKDEEITISFDLSKFPDGYQYTDYGIIMFQSDEDNENAFFIFDEIASFKYNDEEVIKVEKAIEQLDNNNYIIGAYGMNLANIYCHKNPSKTDKITIAGKTNEKYENIAAVLLLYSTE